MVLNKTTTIKTKGDCDIINITPEVTEMVGNSGLSNGIVTVFVAGSTAGVTTTEFEPGLLADLNLVWDRLAPKNITYQHDRAWGDGNGHSHIRATLLGPSLTVPFIDKRMALGTWQQIVLVDFDNRQRSRDIVIQVIGE